MSQPPTFMVEYVEPVEAEPLPDEFSVSRLRRSLLLLDAVVVAVVAAIVLLPGLGSLRSRFEVPGPNGSRWPPCFSSGPARAMSWSSVVCSAGG